MPAIPEASGQAEAAPAYRVLARKYRPQNFSQLIGQDVLVRTLTNAFRTNRIAHAFMLTGVRGIGKTTTARIIARGLNCIGADGMGGPTVEPCGVCANCVAIAADRHVDVIEMDAASHNSVDDIRELTDGARYSPALGRYKVYIVDEVHMLSKPAFNALLKTLEEPPPHVKFVLATTEIRKVPVTILSRCQRFDLRRVESTVLQKHFAGILQQEGKAADDAALVLLARAADGSVRDGLSLLDQAIARAEGDMVVGDEVRAMLGLADRIAVFDLLETILRGEARPTLDTLDFMHEAGADPATILQDLLELVHHVTRLKLVPASADDPGTPEAERARGSALAGGLSMPVLSRAWAVLLKGMNEVSYAPNPREALEMVVLRLMYSADLPHPADLVKQLTAQTDTPPPGGNGVGGEGNSGGLRGSGGMATAPARASTSAVTYAAAAPQPAPTQAVDAEPTARHPLPLTFAAVVELFQAERQAIVAGHLYSAVQLIRFEPGLIEFHPRASVPRDLASTVARRLEEWTGRRWMVSLSAAPGAPTLAEQETQRNNEAVSEASGHPTVQALMAAFPGAKLKDVRLPAVQSAADIPLAPTSGGDILPGGDGADEEWLEE